MARAQLNKANASGKWTPNQQAKRVEIIDAAARVLSTVGLAGCTARTVSEVAPLTTSALHYYFDSIEEIIDLAFRKLTVGFQERVHQAASRESDPVDALWAAANAYIRHGTEWQDPARPPQRERAPMLWFEYQAASLRSGHLETVREISSTGSAFFESLLAAVGVENHAALSSTLYSALLGSAIRDSLFHRPAAELLGELSATLNIPPSPKYCSTAPTAQPRARRQAASR